MAATKSLVSLCSQAALLFAVAAMVVQTQVAQPQAQAQAQTCSDQLGNVNVCAPYVLPGAATNPSAECCAALQATQHDCLCSTLSIAARLPSLCKLPPLSCGS